MAGLSVSKWKGWLGADGGTRWREPDSLCGAGVAEVEEGGLRTPPPLSGRRILNHCATRDVELTRRPHALPSDPCHLSPAHALSYITRRHRALGLSLGLPRVQRVTRGGGKANRRCIIELVTPGGKGLSPAGDPLRDCLHLSIACLGHGRGGYLFIH